MTVKIIRGDNESVISMVNRPIDYTHCLHNIMMGKVQRDAKT